MNSISTSLDEPTPVDDRGAVLPLVLVFIALAAFIAIPLLAYATTVVQSGEIQSDKAEGVEFARGGTWVALSHQADLYDMCVGATLPSSLEDVTTGCEVLRVEQLRPIEEVPFHVATVLADTQVPAQLADGNEYVNPNTAADPGAWITNGDATAASEAGKVWLPQLPVQATSGGGSRDTTMPPGTQDPNYSSCRVLFPGTFDTPLTFDSPTYLTSGVYHFTEPVTLRPGADVVVGDGSAVGCTTDFEAIGAAVTVPDPLNMSGLGGTIVLGGNGRIEVDDSSGSDEIRFVINRRYVSIDENSVQASSDVSIVSVNGAHEPLLAGETAGDPLGIADRLYVPASTVGTSGDPLAIDQGYEASTVSFRPGVPDEPVVTAAVDWQVAEDDSADDGRLTVTWDEPAANGSRITGYVATDTTTGLSCSPPAPSAPDYTVQTSCTIIDHPGHAQSGPWAEVEVVAINAIGASDPSAVFSGPRVDLVGGAESPEFARPGAPTDLAVSADYSDGIEISWGAPTGDGGSPIASYRVTIDDAASGLTLGQCTAWFDETSCVVPLGPSDGPQIDITVEALHIEGDPSAVYPGDPAVLTAVSWVPSADPTPADPAIPAVTFEPTPILDFATTSSNSVDIDIAGYVAVPQGKVSIGAVNPAFTAVEMSGGLLAAEIELDAGGSTPSSLTIEFDNPEAQKQVRLRSVYTGGRVPVVSEAVVQINRSGSIGINSWIVGAESTVDGTSGGSGSGTTVPTTVAPTTTAPATTAPPTTAPATTAPATTAPPTTAPPTTAPPTTTPPTTTTTTTTTTVPPTTTTLPPDYTGPTHPTITGDSGQPIGNHPERDYCASGQTGWTVNWGDGTWLAEYWNFDSSMNTGNLGENIFVGAPDAWEYTDDVWFDWSDDNGPAGQNDYFGARFTATINVPAGCTMKIAPGGNNGYALYVDGALTASDWGNLSTTYDVQDVTITEGQHLLVLEYYEWAQWANVSLWWRLNS